MDPLCNCEKQEYHDFYSLTVVICDTSTISAKFGVLLKETFQVNIEHSYSLIGNKYSLKLIPTLQKISRFKKIYPEPSK